MPIPENPKIYHILHWDKLASVIDSGGLLCDAVIANDPPIGTTIGMTNIKRRRIRKPVVCHWGTKVADYVPFYFCPRSVMLNAIHHKNRNPNSRASSLSYIGGQEPVVHLESDLHQVVDWADGDRRRWAFSTINASANGAQFYSDLAKLSEINWSAVEADVWNRSGIKEAKQAEFLVYGFFPWHLVYRIGVINTQVRQRVVSIVNDANHRPEVIVERDWYYGLR